MQGISASSATVREEPLRECFTAATVTVLEAEAPSRVLNEPRHLGTDGIVNLVPLPLTRADSTTPKPRMKRWNILVNKDVPTSRAQVDAVVTALPEPVHAPVQLLPDPFDDHHWKLRTVELCCGCARFSLHLMRAGAVVIAVDKLLNPHIASVPVLADSVSSFSSR